MPETRKRNKQTNKEMVRQQTTSQREPFKSSQVKSGDAGAASRDQVSVCISAVSVRACACHLLPERELVDVVGEHAAAGDEDGVRRRHDGCGDGAQPDEGHDGRRQVRQRHRKRQRGLDRHQSAVHGLLIVARLGPICPKRKEGKCLTNYGQT